MIYRNTNTTLKILLILFLCSFSRLGAASDKPVLGKDYIEIYGGTETRRDEVVLFYIVGCGLCKILDDVFMQRIVLSSSTALYNYVPFLVRLEGKSDRKFTPMARMDLAGRSLGLSSHAIDKIWALARQPSSRRTFSDTDEAAKFLASIGAQEADASRTLESFEMAKKLKRASDLTHSLAIPTENYGPEEVIPYIYGIKDWNDGSPVAKELTMSGGNLPIVVVNRKYKITIDMAGGTETVADSAERLLQTVFYLINQ